VSPTWTTFLFETANFLILTAVLGWLLFRPIRQALENRRMALAKEAEEAAAKGAEVKRLQEETRQRYAALDAELERLRHDVHVAAQQEAEQLRSEAHATVEREREAARHRLAHLEEAQLEHLAAAVATAAGTVVERLLRQLDGPDVERGLIRAACHELQALDGNDLGAVRVESAHPLDQATQDELTTALGKASRTLEFRVSPNLGAGIRISTSRGLIDASAAGLAAFARGALAEQLGMPQNGHSRSPTSTPEEIANHD
jgi:F0F1-type ATP synthase membrane subunit b/b'